MVRENLKAWDLMVVMDSLLAVTYQEGDEEYHDRRSLNTEILQH